MVGRCPSWLLRRCHQAGVSSRNRVKPIRFDSRAGLVPATRGSSVLFSRRACLQYRQWRVLASKAEVFRAFAHGATIAAPKRWAGAPHRALRSLKGGSRETLLWARMGLWRFADRAPRFDAGKHVGCGKGFGCTAHQRIRGANGTIQKQQVKTCTCRNISITVACYLCNTHWKRGEAGAFEAVPLLLVQESSVIVISRRRGASRGRPVRWFA
jgi:hypothetical protein